MSTSAVKLPRSTDARTCAVQHDATLGFTILTFGGPALFLLAQLLFQHATLGRTPRSRALGLGALAILAIAAAQLPLIVGIAASTAVLIVVAITDTVHEGVQVHRWMTRVLALGGRSRLAFQLHWLAVGPFSALIRRRWLRAIAARAQSV
jgi:hypothetical protein